MSFEIDTDELSGALTNLSDCVNALRKAMWALDQTKVDLGAAMNEHPQVLQSLVVAAENTAHFASLAALYQDSLESIIRVYDRTEDEVFGEGQRVRLDEGQHAGWAGGVTPQVEAWNPRAGEYATTQGPQFFRGAREGPLRLAEDLFSAATRPLG